MFLKKITIIFVALILLSPIILAILGVRVGQAVKQGSVPFPPSETLTVNDIKMEYFRNLEQWFGSNNSFEGFYIRLWNQLRWSLFNVSDELVAGIEGWEVDKKSVYDLLPASDLLADSDIDITIKLISRFKHYLDQKGIHFLIVVIPFKSTVYPEKFAQSGIPERHESSLKKFQAAFLNNDIDYIDAYDILKRNKEKIVFYKTDLHFNTVGADLVSRSILAHLYKKFNLEIPEMETPKVVYQNFSGGSANIAMPLFYGFSEDVPVVSAPQLYRREEVEHPSSGSKQVKFYSTIKDRQLLPDTIMYGNSFMLLYPSVGLQNHFSSFTSILDYEDFRFSLDHITEDTKVVILHLYETQLLLHLPHNNPRNYWDPRVYDLPLPSGSG
ncbi:MAG TPA: hypothetical protein PKA63_08130 [Oligoflexia bacterium]|nr:hypothetical protein [Oligoflexia bacterium]HMP48618.1 hypothetical protein [Oligoflexia bacterium]